LKFRQYFKFMKSKKIEKNCLRIVNKKINLPCFMPCATRGVVRAVSFDEIKKIGFQMVLVNAYHLYLTPGLKVIRAMGGLHKFMGWDGAILCDSGGFQVFSLKPKLTSEGVKFQSHIDGSTHFFSPEKVWEINMALGTNIAMPLDDCPPGTATKKRVAESVERTHRWLLKTIDAKDNQKGNKPKLFGIVQGGIYLDLRKKSADFVSELYKKGKIDGIAVGGVAVGEQKTKIKQVICWTSRWLPQDAPKYLMGIGEPEDIIYAVKYGFQMFDCVLPTRLGRHGIAYTQFQSLNLKFQNNNQKLNNFQFHKLDLGKSKFKTDKKWAYLHHLIRLKEIEGLRICSLNNLNIYHALMEELAKIT